MQLMQMFEQDFFTYFKVSGNSLLFVVNIFHFTWKLSYFALNAS